VGLGHEYGVELPLNRLLLALLLIISKADAKS